MSPPAPPSLPGVKGVRGPGKTGSQGGLNVADFWTVFGIFISRLDRWAVLAVRGRQFRPFPNDFGGPGGPGQN